MTLSDGVIIFSAVLSALRVNDLIRFIEERRSASIKGAAK